jgi:hypothetical protein
MADLRVRRDPRIVGPRNRDPQRLSQRGHVDARRLSSM